MLHELQTNILIDAGCSVSSLKNPQPGPSHLQGALCWPGTTSSLEKVITACYCSFILH